MPVQLTLAEGDVGDELTLHLKQFAIVGPEAEKIRRNRVAANLTAKVAYQALCALNVVYEKIIGEWITAGIVTNKAPFNADLIAIHGSVRHW